MANYILLLTFIPEGRERIVIDRDSVQRAVEIIDIPEPRLWASMLCWISMISSTYSPRRITNLPPGSRWSQVWLRTSTKRRWPRFPLLVLKIL